MTSYFEWVGAGELELESAGGSMHRVAPTRQSVVTGLRFGFDPTHLYVRVDFSRRAQDVLADKGEVELTFLTPADTRLVRVRADGAQAVAGARAAADARPLDSRGWRWPAAAAGQILELSLSWQALGVGRRRTLGCFVAVLQDGHELERHPAAPAARDSTVPGGDFAAQHWSV